MFDPTNKLEMAFVAERSPRECVVVIVETPTKNGNVRDQMLHYCVSCAVDIARDFEFFPGADMYIDTLATPMRCNRCRNAMSVRSRVWTAQP